MKINYPPSNRQTTFGTLRMSEQAKLWMANQITETDDVTDIYKTLNYLKEKSGQEIEIDFSTSYIAKNSYREKAIRVSLTPHVNSLLNIDYCIGCEKLYPQTISLPELLKNTKKHLDRNLFNKNKIEQTKFQDSNKSLEKQKLIIDELTKLCK